MKSYNQTFNHSKNMYVRDHVTELGSSIQPRAMRRHIDPVCKSFAALRKPAEVAEDFRRGATVHKRSPDEPQIISPSRSCSNWTGSH